MDLCSVAEYAIEKAVKRYYTSTTSRWKQMKVARECEVSRQCVQDRFKQVEEHRPDRYGREEEDEEGED